MFAPIAEIFQILYSLLRDEYLTREVIETLSKIRFRGFHIDDIALLSLPEHGFTVAPNDFLYNIIEIRRSIQAKAVTGLGNQANLPEEARDVASLPIISNEQ